MDARENWDQIKITFDAAIRTSRHCAIATIGPDGFPHIAPIGFIFLRDDYSAYYFEEHARRLGANLDNDPRVCVLLVNSGARFWLSFLLRGAFPSSPGLRLAGHAGQRRKASAEELAALQRRLKPFGRLPGAQLIWDRLEHVRDIRFDSVHPVIYPNVSEHFWT
jgi:hypothetical protein